MFVVSFRCILNKHVYCIILFSKGNMELAITTLIFGKNNHWVNKPRRGHWNHWAMWHMSGEKKRLSKPILGCYFWKISIHNPGKHAVVSICCVVMNLKTKKNFTLTRTWYVFTKLPLILIKKSNRRRNFFLSLYHLFMWVIGLGNCNAFRFQMNGRGAQLVKRINSLSRYQDFFLNI